MMDVERTHYCRSCTQSFPATPGSTPSAHMQYVLHVVRAHPAPEDEREHDIRRCGRNCEAREQADEHRFSARLYGPGSVRRRDVQPLISRYDTLFPVEEDDHS